jgi:hypothetical protein
MQCCEAALGCCTLHLVPILLLLCARLGQSHNQPAAAAATADHSLQPELAQLYDTDRAAFNKAAREHTKRHAM